MEAGDLADGLGEGIGEAVGRVRCEGEESWAELADVPGGPVAAAGAGSVRGTQPVQDDSEAGGCSAGPVLIRGVLGACLGGDGGVHQARLSARYSGVTRSLLVTWRVSGSNRQAMMVEKRPVRTSPYSSSRCPSR